MNSEKRKIHFTFLLFSLFHFHVRTRSPTISSCHAPMSLDIPSMSEFLTSVMRLMVRLLLARRCAFDLSV